MKYCALPFKGLYVYPNGDVRVCGWTYQCIGNLLEEDLDTIWHGEKVEQIRESVRDGSFKLCNKTACQYCANDSLEELTKEEFKKFTVASDKPKIIDAAYDYICNHSCPSCRHEIFKADSEYIANINTISKKLIPILNQSEEFMINGNGDLFASPYIMDMMENIRPINNNCKILIQTNAILFDERNWKRIKHLRSTDLTVTVTPNSFERLTYKYLSGGHDNLDILIKNLHFIKSLRRSGEIKKFDISIVVQDKNYQELPSFVERCLDEFECDRVVIKPIFYWFALTHEEYWFKDILNPKHPYFKQYMEILKNPILKNERVYFWGSHNIHEEKEHPYYNYKIYFDAFSKMLNTPEPKKLLEQKMLDKGYNKIAIYGVNENAEMLCNLMTGIQIEVIGFIDRYATVAEFCNLPVTKVDRFKPDMVDTILVSNFVFLENITRDLNFQGFKGNIIPFNEI